MILANNAPVVGINGVLDLLDLVQSKAKVALPVAHKLTYRESRAGCHGYFRALLSKVKRPGEAHQARAKINHFIRLHSGTVDYPACQPNTLGEHRLHGEVLGQP